MTLDPAPLRARMRPLALVPVLLVLALAGCTDQETPTDDLTVQAPPADEGDATGSLLVVVVTPDLKPIEGAVVHVDNLELSTDRTGSARAAGLAPGSRVIEVDKPGFRPARQGIDIVAGEETRSEVKLLPSPAGGTGPQEEAPPTDGDGTPEPQVFQEVFHYQGYFDCSATYLIITGDCLLVADVAVDGAFGAVNGTPPVRPGDATSEEFVLEFPLDFDWRTVVAEMHWNATTLAGERMTFALEPAEAPEDGHAAKYGRAEGGSPLLVRLEPGVPHENATASADGEEPDMPNVQGGEVLRTRSYVQGEFHRPGGTEFLGVGAAVNQKFDVYVTVFYGGPAPAGYTIGGP